MSPGLLSTFTSRPRLRERLLVYLGCASLALLANFLLGKEMAWDTISYHLYAGFSAVHDRFGLDYFAAGSQSYANPYAFVPFYLLATSGLSALQAASVLAVAHALLLYLTYELALRFCPGATRRAGWAIALCATALAALNPILIQQIGSSLSDITTATLVVGAWVLIAGAIRTPRAGPLLLAAALLGASTALKLTNAVHTVAAGILLLFLQEPWRARIRHGAIFAGSVAISFAAVATPWALKLERQFGNPFFPFLNNVFRSPEFSTEPLRHLRFVPSGLAEALWRPFAMLDPAPMVHEEPSAPDLRYAVLLLLAAALAAKWLYAKRSGGAHRPATKSGIDTRILAAGGIAFAVDWTLWLAVSGNGRYFIAMACVSAVLVVALLFMLLPGAANLRFRIYILAALFGVQAIQLWMAADLRWNGVPWNGAPWFQLQMPARLMNEPDLYLGMGTRSNSYVVPFLPPGSGMINFSGGYPLPAASPNGARVREMIGSHLLHIRFLIAGDRLHEESEQLYPSAREVDTALRQYGLRVKPDDCATITVYDLPPDLEITVIRSGKPTRRPAPKDRSFLVSCRLVPAGSQPQMDPEGLRLANAALDHLEDACPQLFQPRRSPTDILENRWRRMYINTDLIAWVSYNRVKFIDPTRGDDVVQLGSLEDWAHAPLPVLCGRHNGHYYVRPEESVRKN